MEKITKRPQVTAVLAAYNEEQAIAETVKTVMKIPGVSKVLVVDDGSRDATADKAEQAGADVLRFSVNEGKGCALNKALPLLDCEFVLFIDGDLAEYALEGSKLLEAVMSGKADMAIANFPKPKKKGGFGLVKGLGRWAILHFTGYNMTEPLSGQRALKKEFLDGIKFEKGFGVEVGFTIDVLKKGGKVVEVQTSMSHRETGRDISGFLHRGIQFKDVFKVFLKRKISKNRR